MKAVSETDNDEQMTCVANRAALQGRYGCGFSQPLTRLK